MPQYRVHAHHNTTGRHASATVTHPDPLDPDHANQTVTAQRTLASLNPTTTAEGWVITEWHPITDTQERA